MPKEIVAYTCEFCIEFVKRNGGVVALHERNVHAQALFNAKVKEAVHVIASSGKDPRQDRGLVFTLRRFPPKVARAAIQHWETKIVPNLHKR